MKKLIIANWKMQLDYSSSLSLLKKIKQKIKKSDNEVVVCPDYLCLSAASLLLKNSSLQLGAQDSAVDDFGAYTGEVSAFNLKYLGVKYVIIGHSERREHLHENSAIINLKIKVALKNKLVPVLCVGEKLETREAGETKKHISEQLRHALKEVKIKKSTDLVIAYEPLWAIGSGRAIEPKEADEITLFIKQQVIKILRKKVNVLYGGSVSSINYSDFLQKKNIDGLLVGGASLKSEEFSKICL